MSETIRNSIIANAECELGITESPKDSNIVKYNDWYYPEYSNEEKRIQHKYRTHPEEFPWCGTFCSYVYHFAGWTMPPIDTEIGFHYVPTLFYKAKAMKWNTNDPKPGDLVIFDFKVDDKQDIQHVGIFHSWIEKGISFTSIEGNTASSDKGSQSNGGGVFKKKRSIVNVIQFVNLIDNVK